MFVRRQHDPVRGRGEDGVGSERRTREERRERAAALGPNASTSRKSRFQSAYGVAKTAVTLSASLATRQGLDVAVTVGEDRAQAPRPQPPAHEVVAVERGAVAPFFVGRDGVLHGLRGERGEFGRGDGPFSPERLPALVVRKAEGTMRSLIASVDGVAPGSRKVQPLKGPGSEMLTVSAFREPDFAGSRRSGRQGRGPRPRRGPAPRPGRVILRGPFRYCKRRSRVSVAKVKINATAIVMRSRLRSTTVEPEAAEPIEPPKRSEMPPPRPECNKTRKIRPTAANASIVMNVQVNNDASD